MRPGDVCRARCTAPARYLAEDLCLYVSAMSNDLSVDVAEEQSVVFANPVLPSDEAVAGALAVMRSAWARKNRKETFHVDHPNQ
jgi:hypothetical protein